jgi:hypothetical protein
VSGFWFRAGSAVNLGLMRVMAGTFTMWLFLLHERRWLGQANQLAVVFEPIGVASWLEAPMPIETFTLIFRITQVLCVLFTLGLGFRVVGPLYGALALFVVTYAENSWSMVYHTENMLCVHLLVLGVTRSAARVSVDAILRERFGNVPWLFASAVRSETELHEDTGWPIKLLQLATTLPYVIAGIAKLRATGVAWSLGHNLRDQIVMNGLYYELVVGTTETMSKAVYGWEWAFTLLASGTLMLELGAPLALIGPRAGYFVAINLFCMHWGIRWLMGIEFPYQMYGFAFACFFPWDFLRSKWRAHGAIQARTSTA